MPKAIRPCGKRVHPPEQVPDGTTPSPSLAARFIALGLIPPLDGEIQRRDWKAMVLRQPPAQRFVAYCELLDDLGDVETAQLFAVTWVGSEGCFTREQIDAIFRSFEPRRITRDELMTPNEQAVFRSLPATITIFRGCQESTRDGISWTLSLKTAKTFAERASGESPDGEGIVIRARCLKTQVKAYFDDEQHEQEIIVLPDAVTIEAKPLKRIRYHD